MQTTRRRPDLPKREAKEISYASNTNQLHQPTVRRKDGVAYEPEESAALCRHHRLRGGQLPFGRRLPKWLNLQLRHGELTAITFKVVIVKQQQTQQQEWAHKWAHKWAHRWAHKLDARTAGRVDEAHA